MPLPLPVLLSEPVSAAISRARTAFDVAAGEFPEQLVLFGAGGLGRKCVSALCQCGKPPLAIADNNSRLWGTSIQGIPVVAPADAAARFGQSACFVICVWHTGRERSSRAIRNQLMRLGVATVAHCGLLFWKYPQLLPHYALDLPHKVLEQRNEILRAMALLHEDESREQFVAQVQWRLTLAFDVLPDADPAEQYFPGDLFRWVNGEMFVDCGAYDGDTLKPLFSHHIGSTARAIAFEPDPANVSRLRSWLDAQPAEVRDRVELHAVAVADHDGTVCFDAAGNAGSAIGAGDLHVPCVCLDSALAGKTPSYIKMDIEGAEPAAIAGGLATIRKHRPVLAVCIYHKQDHLWAIPNLLGEDLQDYAYFIRAYTPETWDVVLFAVPRERLINQCMTSERHET